MPLPLIPKPVPHRLQGMTVLFVVVDCEVYGGVQLVDSGEEVVTVDVAVGREVDGFIVGQEVVFTVIISYKFFFYAIGTCVKRKLASVFQKK